MTVEEIMSLNPNYKPYYKLMDSVEFKNKIFHIINIFYTYRQGDEAKIPMYVFNDNEIAYCEIFDKLII